MNIFSEKVNVNKQGPIKNFVVKHFDVEVKPKQYAFWELKHKEFVATFYNSGKFVVQGKNIPLLLNKLTLEFDEIIAPEQTNTPTKQTKNTTKENSSLILSHSLPYIGTDESGKGDFFGPLVVAGVLLDERNIKLFEDLGIRDSKTLKDEQMIKMMHEIQKNSTFSVVSISNAKYNELYVKFKNLNKLLAWGHAKVIENILEKKDCEYALSDKFGDESLIKNALQSKGRKIILEQRTKAESDIAVAAASVLARATFVQRMKDMEGYYGQKFPKGCNEQVKDSAREFVKVYGKNRLYEVCKAHFKTFHELY